MQVRKVGFAEAVRLLQEFKPAVIPATPPPTPPTPPITENKPYKASYEKFYVPSEWLAKRGYSVATLKHFGVGQYDNPKRQSLYKGKILLPVRRYADGELVAYLARNPEPKEGEAKYIWPRGFSKHLEVYGAWQLKEKAPLRVLYVVESPFCVMKFYEYGLPAVSGFGWSLSEEQMHLLGQLAKGCIFLPDQNKSIEALSFAGKLTKHCWVRMPDLPDGVVDPEQMTLEQIQALT